MRILVIIANPVGRRRPGMLGGNEINVIEVLERIYKHGISVETIELSPAASLSFEVNYKIHQVTIPLFKLRAGVLIDIIKFLFWIVGSFKVILNLRWRKYDVIVAATANISDTLPALVASKILGSPMVVNHQAVLTTISLSDFYENIRADNANVLDSLIRSIGLKLSFNILKRANAIICNSESVAASLRNNYSYRNKLFVVNMGIDVERINSISIPEKEYDAAFMARIERSKGILDVLYAWHTLIKQYRNAKIIIIGDGSYLNKAKSIVKELGMERNVVFTGFIKGYEKYVYLKKSKIFIYPTLATEGFPRVILEAMCCGLPIITYDNPTLPRTLKSCKGVIFVPMGNVGALSDAISRLLITENVKFIEIERSLKSYVKQYSWEIIVPYYIEILKRIAQNKRVINF
jgi:glycosyltransferase involved in cell wall biosynthesis